MKKRLISILLVVCMALPMLSIRAVAAQDRVESESSLNNPLSDVKESDWFYDNVMYALQKGLFAGVSDTEFDPKGTMTRAMYVTVMGRIAEIDINEFKGETGFSDVPQNHWAATYIRWAKEQGITGGVGNRQFAPNGLVTREQMAALTVRFFESYGIPFPDKTTDTQPVDFDSIADYAKDAVLKLWSCGLFKGDNKGSFNPKSNTTRAEAAAFYSRIEEVVEEWYIEIGKKDETGKKDVPIDNSSGSSATYYTFKFVTNDGTAISDRSIREGRKLDNLPTPYKADSIFVGWCYDEELSKPVASSDTAKESLILYAKYEEISPLNEDEQTPVAIALDSGKNFTVQISSTEDISIDVLKERITAKNLSTNEDKEWFCITKDGNTFTISGYNYSGEGGARQAGFVEGSAYKITLEDDGLSFVGQDTSARVYDFTIKRTEVINVGINENVKELSIKDISNLTVNGKATTTISIPVITLGANGTPADTGVTTGSFTYTEGSLAVGDTIIIYEGHQAPVINMENAVGKDNNAFVEITNKIGSNYEYKTADAENILFTPDVLPLSITSDTDGDVGDTSITVPVSAMTYTDDRYAMAGLDSQTTVDKGDFISFYSGALKDDGTIEGGQTEFYGQILSVETVDESYVITYKTVNLSELQAAMAACKKNSVDGETLLEGAQKAEIERGVEKQARESGFADEAGMYLASMALETDSFTELSDFYDLKSVEMQMNGEPITPETLQLMGSTKAEVEVSKLKATLGTELVHFEGIPGVRLTLEVGIKITVTTEKAKIEIEVTGLFEQEVHLDIGVSGDAVWKWWGIFPYIAEYEVTAYTEFYTYTGIGIEATIVTKEKEDEGGYGTGNEMLEKIGKQIKELMDKKEKYLGDGSGTVGNSLEEKYASMLENESDWVNLFEKKFVDKDFKILEIIAIKLEVAFIVSANMNISLGVDFWYENAKRYIYTVQIFGGTVKNDTIDLVESHYEFEFYVMGTMGLRAGIKLSLKVGLFSTDLASVGFGAEAGVYVRVWGYFYYQLAYHANANPQITSSFSGALLFELGVYVEITFEAQALKGTFKYNPTLYGEEWPLWSAGVRENVRDFAYEQEDTPKIGLKQYITTTQVPDSIFEMAYLDLKEGLDDGELFTAIYDSEGIKDAQTDEDKENNDDEANFKISMTNKAFSYNPKTNQITVTPGDAPKQDGEMIITWINQPLAFSSAPLERRISLHWDNLRDGYVIVPYTNGGSYLPIVVKKYEEKLIAPQNPTKAGYVFAGWFQNKGLTQNYTFPELMTDTDTDIYAKWEAATNTEYIINHYQQVLGSSQYALADTETLYGTTNSTVKPLTKSYIGYKTPAEKELVILPDGSATLNYYYDLQTHTVTFKPGVIGGNDEVIPLKFSSTITAPQFAAKGYTFTGWDKTVRTHMGEQDLVYTAQWQKDTSTEYRVEYYVQQPDGRFMLQDIETRTGKTGEQVSTDGLRRDNVYAKTGVTRFQNVTVKGEPLESTAITGDGKTVIKVNYAREQYTVTFQPENGTGSIVYTLYSGAKIVPPTISKLGFDFSAWGGMAETVGTENLTYTASWKARTDTSYIVRHIREDLNGAYPTEGALVEVEQKDDGVTYDSAYGTLPTPEYSGYFFTGWTIGSIPITAETAVKTADNHELTANWVANDKTAYTIRHFQQNVTGSEYTQIGADVTGYGETDTDTAAAPNSYEGFTAQDIKQVNIAGDGLSVVEIYYDRNVHTVTWNANGGDEIANCDYRYGATITTPPAIRTGYTFTGWNIPPETTMPDRDLCYTAQWRANTYTVSFNSDGGSSVSAIDVTYDGKYPALAAPSRSGYTFDGWFLDGTEMNEGDSVAITANTALTAHWTANTYTVGFDLNGGTGQELQNITVTYDGKYGNLPEATATLTGCSFDGWYTAASGGTKVESSTTVKNAGDHNLYAHWKVNQYAITLSENGGNALDDLRADYNATVTLPVAERDGYTFTGWKLNDFTTYGANQQITMPADGLTLTAQWCINKYTVTFNSDGGTTIAPITTDYNTKIIAPSAPTKNGYDFAEWQKGSSAFSFDTAITNNIELKAKWEATDYQISYQNVGDDVTNINPASYTIESDAITLSSLDNKTGYDFDGWYSSSDLAETAKVSGVAIASGSTGVKTFYAKWTAIQYGVNFDDGTQSANAGGSMSAVTFTYDQNGSLPTNKYSNAGYTFKGWSRTENGSVEFTDGQVITNNALYSQGGAVTLFAQWEPISYTISYTFGVGGSGANNPTSYNITTNDITLRAPSTINNGFQFLGWYLGTTQVTSITKGSIGNRSLTAKWAHGGTFSLSYVSTSGSTSTYKITRTIPEGAVATSDPQNVYYRTVNGTAIGGTAQAVHFQHVGGENVYATFTSSDGNGSAKTFTVTGENATPTYQSGNTQNSANVLASAYTGGANRYYNVELYKVVSTQSNCTGALDSSKKSVTREIAQNLDYEIVAAMYSTKTETPSLTVNALSETVASGFVGDGETNNVAWNISAYDSKNWSRSTKVSFSDKAKAYLNATAGGFNYYFTLSAKYSDEGYEYMWMGDHQPNSNLTASKYSDSAVSLTDSGWGAGKWSTYWDNINQQVTSATISFGINDTAWACFGASGSGDDIWNITSFTDYLTVYDTKEPTQLGIAPMAEGLYRRGDTISISVVYDEIVVNRNSATLGAITGLSLTNVTYQSGEGTNVLTFTATVNQDIYMVGNIDLMQQKPINVTVYDMAN